MRIDIRSPDWPLSPELRTRARDRIRLALGRHAPDVARIRAIFAGTGESLEAPGTGLTMVAVLHDGRALEVAEALPTSRSVRLEVLVDRVAHRVARGVQRTVTAAPDRRRPGAA